MTKTVFFNIYTSSRPKHVKAMLNQDFYDDSPATDFIAQIGEQNVISISYFGRGVGFPICAITYRDDELLTCPKCTRELTHEFTFCPHCGARLN